MYDWIMTLTVKYKYKFTDHNYSQKSDSSLNSYSSLRMRKDLLMSKIGVDLSNLRHFRSVLPHMRNIFGVSLKKKNILIFEFLMRRKLWAHFLTVGGKMPKKFFVKNQILEGIWKLFFYWIKFWMRLCREKLCYILFRRENSLKNMNEIEQFSFLILNWWIHKDKVLNNKEK